MEREPQRLEQWYAEDLHARIRERHAQAKETFVLHDGPPFANGDVHIGTALNKILKDAILKFQTMRGKNVPYVPGWDCHGLPIEFKVVQELRKAGREDASPAEIRRECEAYARKYIDHQRTQFKRLGVFGDWENPYLTLDKKYEADELRLFADIIERVLSIVAKARVLEHPLPYGVGRGRSGVRGSRQPIDFCEVPGRRPRRHVPDHLDHHALDFQPTSPWHTIRSSPTCVQSGHRNVSARENAAAQGGRDVRLGECRDARGNFLRGTGRVALRASVHRQDRPSAGRRYVCRE